MWGYIRHLWEGIDNRPSLRRFISLIVLALIIYLVIKGVSSQYILYALYSLETTLLLLISVITADNIITFFKGKTDDQK